MRRLLSTALLLVPALAHAEPISADRVYVVDGDTITVDRGRPVRLVGFNAPEIRNHAECPAEREKGKEATRRLRELVAFRSARSELRSLRMHAGLTGGLEL